MIRIGIDGGGTKTRALVLDEGLQVLGVGASASSNPYAVGLERAIASILESADFALGQAGLGRESVASWGLGLGGVTSDLESARVETALRAHLGGATKIVAREDVVAAHRGAFPEASESHIQILCIAGTGSNCFGRAPTGETAKSDGIGPLLGDRGSGYRIGEAALRLYGLEADGVAPETALSPAILAHFGAADLAELIQIVYAPDFERSSAASLAPLVVQLADSRHEGARRILANAGRDLAATARAVQSRLSEFWASKPNEVALVGGILSGSEVVRASFETALGAGVKLVEARYESAIGAALLARDDRSPPPLAGEG